MKIARCLAGIFAALTIAISLGLAPRAAHAFAFTPLNVVDAQGVFIGVGTPASMDQAPRWDDLNVTAGLSYSVGGGFIEFWHNFIFTDGTTAQQLQAGIASVFGIWAAADRALTFDLGSFNADTNFDLTSCTDKTCSFVNPNASEIIGNNIDIFPAAMPTIGGLTFTFGTQIPVHLTNGFSTNPNGLFPSWQILASDIVMNSALSWTLPGFENVLTHEIGHSLGLGDVDVAALFIDSDRNDVTNIIPINQLGDVRQGLLNLQGPIPPPGNTNPNLEPDGNVLMCSGCRHRPSSLMNDDLGGIQFLYPVPEPGTLALLGVGLAGLGFSQRKRFAISRLADNAIRMRLQ